MEIIDYILAAFRTLFGLIITKWFFAVAAPLCLVVERSIQYYNMVNTDFKSPEDRQKYLWKYIQETLVMIATTALLFVWIFGRPTVYDKMLLLAVCVWYVYTLVLSYDFLSDIIKTRKRDADKS